MPFYAYVTPATGEILDVVESLDEPPPPGAIVVELPARDDDVRAWLAAHKRARGGGGLGEVMLDRDEAEDKKKGGRRDEARDAEQFFARLDHETLRAEVEGRDFGVLLFDLHPLDRPRGEELVQAALSGAGQELVQCDCLARLREHLVGVLMPNVDAHALGVRIDRGNVTPLTFTADRPAIEALRRRRHPLLRRDVRRG